jgi:hypothetical protein
MWMWVLGIVLWPAVAAVRPLYRAVTVRIDKITLAVLLFANSDKAGVPSGFTSRTPAGSRPSQLFSSKTAQFLNAAGLQGQPDLAMA